jgi:glyoxylase-like metal-dependent hydrolase (beta-lactamase superfamily II)
MIELDAGVWAFQAPLWQTNSLLCVSSGEGLMCDPAMTPAEIETIVERLQSQTSGRSYLLLTHADYDHVCGVPYFVDAEVVAGADTAGKVRDGSAAVGLVGGGAEWGVEWPSELRVDREVSPGEELELGPFRVVVVDAPSHGREGVGYVLHEQGILLPGDNLSAITYPLLGASLARAREASRRLLETLERFEPRHVVPGHGPVLTSDEAMRIGEDDLRYLEELDAAAGEAAAHGLSPGYALVHVFAVEPPRPNTPDFEIYGIRQGNARLALREHGIAV